MLPSLVHPRSVEAVAAVPAATLGAIAAAAGTLSSDVGARPETAAPAETAVWPATAVPAEPSLVSAQRPPSEQSPDRHDRRESGGNGARPPSRSPTPMTRVAMWAYLGPAEALTEPFPVIPAVGRDEPPSRQKNGQASLGRAQLHGTKGLARRPGESPPWAPVPPPAAAPPKFAPPKSVSPEPVSPQPVPPQFARPKLAPPRPAQPMAPAPRPEPARPPERPRRGRGFKVGVTLALVLALAGSLAFLLKRPGGAAHATAPTTGPSASAPLGTAAEVRDATAAWVASQVSRARPISCDPVMCQALRADGVPVADLLALKPGGGDPLHSGVIVVTPAVIKMVGTEFLTADAPATIASFGSGSRQDSVRVIYPQGAAAYAVALRQDIADRKANESALLENPRVTAPPARPPAAPGRPGRFPAAVYPGRSLRRGGRSSIVAFGDRAPGASPGVPLRSADLAVTGDAAGLARQMSAYARQLQDFFASARIRAVRLANGQDVVQVEFAAPSPLGVLNS